jgi:L-arabinonolactonase
MPIPRPSCPAFGGRNHDILYVTSVSAGLDDRQLREAPLSGGLFAIDVGVRGVPEPRFAG